MLKGDFGEVPLDTPRDRNGSYEPKIIGKGQTRFTGFDDKIISMYARGMSRREIQGHLQVNITEPNNESKINMRMEKSYALSFERFSRRGYSHLKWEHPQMWHEVAGDAIV
jgi:transposase-like protein